METRKAIIIAGNGPSLAEIDYRRYPKNAHVCRCNFFFQERKYYVGDRVDLYIFSTDHPAIGKVHNPSRGFGICINTMKELDLRDEYKINWTNLYSSHMPPNIHSWKIYSSLWGKLPENEILVNMIAEFFRTYVRTDATPYTGVCAILTAIALGYQDIYITGIDNNYVAGAYAWEGKGQANVEAHVTELQVLIIKALSRMEGINVYCISPTSPIAKHIPLAPIVSKTPAFKPKAKAKNAIADLIHPPIMPEPIPEPQPIPIPVPEPKRLIGYRKRAANMVCLFVPSKNLRHKIRARFLP